jgi:hypothetical protein
MNTKRLEKWANGSLFAVARDSEGRFAPGAQGLTLEVWDTAHGPVVKAVRREAGRFVGSTNFRFLANIH